MRGLRRCAVRGCLDTEMTEDSWEVGRVCLAIEEKGKCKLTVRVHPMLPYIFPGEAIGKLVP